MKSSHFVFVFAATYFLVLASCSSTGRGTAEQFARFGFRAEPPTIMTVDDDSTKVLKVDANELLRTALANVLPPDQRNLPIITKETRRLGANGQERFSKLITLVDTLGSPTQQQQIRLTFSGQLLAASEQNCEVYLQNLRTAQVGSRLISDVLSTGLGLAGGLASPIESARILSASSGFATAGGASVDRNIFANQAVELIVDEIRKNRRVSREAIEERLKLPYSDYPINSAHADINLYHGQCTMLSGLASMEAVLAKREAAVNVFRATALRAQNSEITGPELARVIEGIADGFERSVGLPAIKKSSATTITMAVEASDDIRLASTELTACYADDDKIEAAVKYATQAAAPNPDDYADHLTTACAPATTDTTIALLSDKLKTAVVNDKVKFLAGLTAYKAAADDDGRTAAQGTVKDATQAIVSENLEKESGQLRERRAEFAKVATLLSNDVVSVGTLADSLETVRQSGDYADDPFMKIVIETINNPVVTARGTPSAVKTGLAAGQAIVTSSSE